eukprot:1013004_1
MNDSQHYVAIILEYLEKTKHVKKRCLKKLSFTSQITQIGDDSKQATSFKDVGTTALKTLVQDGWVTEYEYCNSRHSVVFMNDDDEKLNSILKMQQEQQLEEERAAEQEREQELVRQLKEREERADRDRLEQLFAGIARQQIGRG